MPDIVINGKSVKVPAGATVLDAARKAGIEIPAMCFLEGKKPFTSCMICVVKDLKSRRLIPSCSAIAAEGMEIETDSDEVRDARKTALELLLSDHTGDCEAPCRRACPADMNIPLMLRQIAEGKHSEALITVKKHIPLPSVLGRICPAPCEKVCRRKEKDAPVSICKLKQFVGDEDIRMSKRFIPEKKEATGKSVAIIGAGPMGLTAAYYLQIAGHRCTIIDEQAVPGGRLTDSIPGDVLPPEILAAEVETIKSLGVEFKMKTKAGRDLPAEQIKNKYDAVILAVGEQGSKEAAEMFGLETAERGIKADSHTLQTANEKIFAGGGAIRPARLAVKSVGDGSAAALSVNQYLAGRKIEGRRKYFDCKTGKLLEGEIDEMMKEADASPPNDALENPAAAAKRCMHCDCRKAGNCKLRDYADEYGADQRRYGGEERKHIVRNMADNVVYEPEKCIKCGICVRITAEQKEELGLTFIGRGFNVKVGPPLNAGLSEALSRTAEKCIAACPTGALAAREEIF